MRCCNCPALGCEGYEYPEEYCCVGISEDDMNEDKHGDWGCNTPPLKIKKMLRENREVLSEFFGY